MSVNNKNNENNEDDLTDAEISEVHGLAKDVITRLLKEPDKEYDIFWDGFKELCPEISKVIEEIVELSLGEYDLLEEEIAFLDGMMFAEYLKNEDHGEEFDIMVYVYVRKLFKEAKVKEQKGLDEISKRDE